MYVVATAGHVDHGKSTLVRALTGTDPDRLSEEKRRGLTIDLGFAWTRLAPGMEPVAFVDVPGHERFIATMLAGLGPAPAVLFVVAADEGWRSQSSEHLAAVDALGLRHGLLIVTRSDLADPAAALVEARSRIARSSLGVVPAIAASALTGTGLDDVRRALRTVVEALPEPRPEGRVRLWVDRAFTLRGTGTVVTGTLGRGTLTVGDDLEVAAVDGRRIRVRALHALQEPREQVRAVARVAANLRGVHPADVGRGLALVTPGAWPLAEEIDVQLGAAALDLPVHLVLHVGTAAVPVRVRPLGGVMARLTLARPQPLEPGDRLVLRDPGQHVVAGGAVVVDCAPPPLRRRGAAAARAEELVRLVDADPAVRLAAEVERRGAVRRDALVACGIAVSDCSAVHVEGPWLIGRDTWQGWLEGLGAAVNERAQRSPLDPRVSDEAARRLLGIPDRALLPPLAAAAGLRHNDGHVTAPLTMTPGIDDATSSGLESLAAHLRADPFAAPEKPQLDAWGVSLRGLAAAERLGGLVRLSPDIVLLPDGPDQALQILTGLPQPFTTSQARQALGTTRRVVIPLLEHLDRRGWTVRVDAGHRRVRSTRT